MENALDNLASIIETIRRDFEARTSARDLALKRSRELIRHCSLSIRASHRHEFEEAQYQMRLARELAAALATELKSYPELYYAGYTQDALKELTEAHIVFALIHHQALPTPAELGVPFPAYLGGLAEAVGELRRFTLDLVRRDRLDEAEKLFVYMDDIYSVLVTIDFPDAITGGLRRQTDMVRGVTERTRGDLTLTMRQQRLEHALRTFEARMAQNRST